MDILAHNLLLFLSIVIGWMSIRFLVFLLIFLFGHLMYKENRVMGFKKSFSEFIPKYENKIDWTGILVIFFAWPCLAACLVFWLFGCYVCR